MHVGLHRIVPIEHGLAVSIRFGELHLGFGLCCGSADGGVFRHEVHIHEGRRTGFVEMHVRLHRVIPIKHGFAVGIGLRELDACGRLRGC